MKTRLAIVLVAATAVGCASGGPKVQQQATPQQMAPQIPDWYNNIPRDQNYLYGRGTATSRDLQTATDQAELSARADLGGQLTSAPSVASWLEAVHGRARPHGHLEA